MNTSLVKRGVEESVTGFGLHKCTFDIFIYSRKEIYIYIYIYIYILLLYLSLSFLLIEIGLAHVKVL
jgi:hypothetical protein